ncbi:pyridoxamine 5'-phosphate oxidase family protein [Inconstantimicrobium mannanitabidum]|uniref:NimC/NimA family protein n=1 Tax=Inconstantimicrobium mannanitabidum TaxID=1604901 RepID=A0ACB5RF06_9CLOT|nr:pyridoxamine 5'-phosphate oxidase family protein [Clostridium sp. TW13]GKX67494.1 NimC/NimA family protein [Clostridium sp. TW13]
MNKVIEFLQKVGTFYLATADDDQPRVRPFGAVVEYNNKIYIATNNTKDCFKQMQQNSKVEISATKGAEWIRLSGTVAVDSSEAAKTAMLEANPALKNMYSVTDGLFEVLYFTKGTATFYSFKGQPETIEI